MPNYPLRLPESVRKAAEAAAEIDGVSLNQFFATAIAEKAAALSGARAWEQRAPRANRARFDDVMSRIGKEPPREGDELPERYKVDPLISVGKMPPLGAIFPRLTPRGIWDES